MLGQGICFITFFIHSLLVVLVAGDKKLGFYYFLHPFAFNRVQRSIWLAQHVEGGFSQLRRGSLDSTPRLGGDTSEGAFQFKVMSSEYKKKHFFWYCFVIFNKYIKTIDIFSVILLLMQHGNESIVNCTGSKLLSYKLCV